MQAEKDDLPVLAYMHFTTDGNIRAWSGNIKDQTLAAVTEAIGRPPTPVCDHATATSKLAELQREVEGLRKDAEKWRRWLPWMRNLNKKPFDLAREIAAIDRSLSGGEGGGNG